MKGSPGIVLLVSYSSMTGAVGAVEIATFEFCRKNGVDVLAAIVFWGTFFRTEGILSVSVPPFFLLREDIEVFPALIEVCRGEGVIVVVAELCSRVLRREGDVFSSDFCMFR